MPATIGTGARLHRAVRVSVQPFEDGATLAQRERMHTSLSVVPRTLDIALSVALVLAGASSAYALDFSKRESEFGNPTWICQSANQLMQENSTNSGNLRIPAADFATWGCLELDGEARPCNDGAYNVSGYLVQDHASLDCAGATLALRGGATGNSRRSAIRTPYSYSVGDIAIRDCQIDESLGYGIGLKRYSAATSRASRPTETTRST